MKINHILGAHTSIAGGVDKAVDLAGKLNFRTMQIFTKNGNRWSDGPLSEQTIENYKNKLSKTKISPVIAHDSYLINLCASKDDLLKKSVDAFVEELERCEKLGIESLNFHPGAHTGRGVEDGLKTIIDSLNAAHERTQNFKVKSMLELTAGQGSTLGSRFEEIRIIIDGVEDKDRMRVCIDTAHIFAAGYDLRSEKAYEDTMKEFDAIIGLDLLSCIHMNDSKKELGSRVDRHTHIGEGFIGLEGFRNIMNDTRLENVPKILETPKDSKEQLEDLKNIETLLSLSKK
ncbi:MAG: deoxyribonuclease IV [Ignavibacteria bacterium]|jgi:deoxyribonuclease-4|nr:deoxyribonuclease IV [Ignavibacteria bacterium]MCU7503623.1 deoxyribonuclease IV [Ignavibacteria bacterium]MCU7517894.1 deoxyribonuclease IV [Ignavibacteria bacterium]